MDYSVAIGIDEYLDDKIKGTPYAENDAKTFSDIMEGLYRVSQSYIFLGEEAKQDKILEKLSHIPAEEGDRIFLFFAGHGSNVYSEPRLCCYDSMSNANKNPLTWLSLKKIMGMFSEKKINIICFIDACQSTIEYHSRGLKQEVIGIEEDSRYTYVFAAANHDESAYSDDVFQHGIWSGFLFEALQGEEAALNNNRLTNNSLQNYLYQRMKNYYIKGEIEQEQNPHAWGKTQKEFIIKEFTQNMDKNKNNDKRSIRIKDIYFGTVDADNEIKENPDKFEENYYDLNDASQKLLEKDNMQFVIGRKGTGKTYLGKYMESSNPSEVRYLSLDNFDYKAFCFLAKRGNGYEPYVEVWKYFILANILMFIKKQTGDANVETVLSELYGRVRSIQQVLNKKFKRPIAIKNSELAEQWMTDLAKEENLFELKEIVQMFLITISDVVKQKHILILDGLDEKINENSHYRDIMNGLIWAVKDINDETYNNEIPVKVIAFFRKDVFELVQGANTAKISLGSTISLEWVTDADDKKKYPLYQFMNIRYKNYIRELGIKNESQEITDILPQNMKISDEEVETWEWLLNLTTYKPRDVVKMLSVCREICDEGDDKIVTSILWEAQREYSKYLIKELKNELYGFVDEDLISAIFTNMRSMGKSWRDYMFVKSIVNKSAKSIKKQLEEDEDKRIIIKMYEVGAFGIMLSNEHEHWAYRKEIKIDNQIETIKFRLHAGLWKELSLW